MIRRFAVAIAMIAALFASRASADTPPRQPHILVILSDDAGYSDFGFTRFAAGDVPGPSTPHLDRLAESGIVCTQAYVTASTCTPSRMGLMSGRYQQRFGAECNVPTIPTPGFTKEDLGLDVQQKTLGTMLKSCGYRTMAIGKWHLGEIDRYHPNERGFDRFYGFLGGSRTYWPLEKPSRGHAIREDSLPVDETKTITYLTDQLTDAAIDFLEASHASGDPAFVYLAYNAVHSPFEAKPSDLDNTQGFEPEVRHKVAAMTKSMDDNIGRILDRLEELKIRDQTLIVFLNDNGGTPGKAHDNGRLRGAKGTYWEGGIRVPMIVSLPEVLAKGTRYESPVSAMDLMPTFFAAATESESVPKSASLPDTDGVNLLPFLTGKRSGPPHESLFWRFWRISAVRQGPWKLIRVADDPLQQERGLLADPILIHLENDPTEQTNVAKQNPDRTRAMLKSIEEWEKGLSAPRWYDGRDWKHWQKAQLKNHRP